MPTRRRQLTTWLTPWSASHFCVVDLLALKRAWQVCTVVKIRQHGFSQPPPNDAPSLWVLIMVSLPITQKARALATPPPPKKMTVCSCKWVRWWDNWSLLTLWLRTKKHIRFHEINCSNRRHLTCRAAITLTWSKIFADDAPQSRNSVHHPEKSS